MADQPILLCANDVCTARANCHRHTPPNMAVSLQGLGMSLNGFLPMDAEGRAAEGITDDDTCRRFWPKDQMMLPGLSGLSPTTIILDEIGAAEAPVRTDVDPPEAVNGSDERSWEYSLSGFKFYTLLLLVWLNIAVTALVKFLQ